MKTLIVRDAPRDFPCLMAALCAYPVAQEQRMDWVRVDKPGHVCDFTVPNLAALIQQAQQNPGGFQPPRVAMGGTKKHEAWGNIIEPRRQVWPVESLK